MYLLSVFTKNKMTNQKTHRRSEKNLRRRQVYCLSLAVLLLFYVTFPIPIIDIDSRISYADPLAGVEGGAASDGAVFYSSFWGRLGEQWSSSSRLPDFSFAGYHSQGVLTPDSTAGVNALNVNDFGANGNDNLDDSDAFIRAIAAANNQVIFIPEGTYLISKILYIRKGNVVLQGENQDRTILRFSESLEGILGPNLNEVGASNWGFRGGLIWVEGTSQVSGTLLAAVIRPAIRGSKELILATTSNINVGDTIQLVQADPAIEPDRGSLLKHFYTDRLIDAASIDPDIIGTKQARFVSKVIEKNSSTITLERSLPFDVREVWQPKIYRFAPSVREVGIEHLTLKFPDAPYPGHFRDKGFNGIYFNRTANNWVKEVTIVNPDNGIFVHNTFFSTFQDVIVSASPARDSSMPHNGIIPVGHHALMVGNYSGDNLFTRFSIEDQFIHDLSVDSYSIGNVFSDGMGKNLNLDHHRQAPYSNLFTNLHFGLGTRPYESGGRSNHGPHAAAYATFWNLQADRPFGLPSADFGPTLNFIAVSEASSSSLVNNWFLERAYPLRIYPENIHEAQFLKRIGGKVAPFYVRLNATPSIGVASLNNVRLTAFVSGAVTGPMTYRFFCTSNALPREYTNRPTPFRPSLSDACHYQTAGTYTARVEVTENGRIATDEVVIVVNPLPNEPPIVDAGADREITLPTNQVELMGTARDPDNFPDPLTVTWTKQGGPGTVTFGNTNRQSTTATFSSAGAYVLRLIASDGVSSVQDDLLVTVNANPVDSFPITVSVVNGRVIKTPDLPSYPTDSFVNLLAVPDSGYQFARWEGAVTGTNNPITVNVQGPTVVTAHFSVSVAASVPADFFVSPQGNDSWSGTFEAPHTNRTDGPFLTLQRAQEAVRTKRRTNPSRSILVLIRVACLAAWKFALEDNIVNTKVTIGGTRRPMHPSSINKEL